MNSGTTCKYYPTRQISIHTGVSVHNIHTGMSIHDNMYIWMHEQPLKYPVQYGSNISTQLQQSDIVINNMKKMELQDVKVIFQYMNNRSLPQLWKLWSKYLNTNYNDTNPKLPAMQVEGKLWSYAWAVPGGVSSLHDLGTRLARNSNTVCRYHIGILK